MKIIIEQLSLTGVNSLDLYVGVYDGSTVGKQATVSCSLSSVTSNYTLYDAITVAILNYANVVNNYSITASDIIYINSKSVDDTAYAVSWDGVTAIAPSKNAIYDQMELGTALPYIKSAQAMGSTIKGITVGFTSAFANGGTNSLTSGTATFIAVYLNASAMIAGVKFIQAVQGSYTADTSNVVGLYTYSGGTLTRVAISTDNGNLWKNAAGATGTQAFTGTYVATAGLYFVGLLYHSSAQVTAPGIASNSTAAATYPRFDLTNSSTFVGTLASQTTLPSSQAMSGLTQTIVNYPFVAIY